MDQMQLVFLSDIGIRTRQEQIDRAAEYRLAKQLREPRTSRDGIAHAVVTWSRSRFAHRTQVTARPAH